MFNSLDSRRKVGPLVRFLQTLYLGYNADQGGHEPLQVNGGGFFNGALRALSLTVTGIATAASAVIGGIAFVGTEKLRVIGDIYADGKTTSIGGFKDINGNGFESDGFGFTTIYNEFGATTTGGSVNFTVTVNTAGVVLPSGGTSWSAVSDETMKTKFTPFVDPLFKISQIRTGTGRYLTDPEDISRSFLSAQSVQAVLPEAVTLQEGNPDRPTELDGKLLLGYTDVIPLLVAAVTEAKTLLDQANARIAALEAKG